MRNSYFENPLRNNKAAIDSAALDSSVLDESSDEKIRENIQKSVKKISADAERQKQIGGFAYRELKKAIANDYVEKLIKTEFGDTESGLLYSLHPDRSFSGQSYTVDSSGNIRKSKRYPIKEWDTRNQMDSAALDAADAGSARIKIELKDGNIAVTHGDSGSVLAKLNDAPEGTWNKIFEALKKLGIK